LNPELPADQTKAKRSISKDLRAKHINKVMESKKGTMEEAKKSIAEKGGIGRQENVIRVAQETALNDSTKVVHLMKCSKNSAEGCSKDDPAQSFVIVPKDGTEWKLEVDSSTTSHTFGEIIARKETADYGGLKKGGVCPSGCGSHQHWVVIGRLVPAGTVSGLAFLPMNVVAGKIVDGDPVPYELRALTVVSKSTLQARARRAAKRMDKEANVDAVNMDDDEDEGDLKPAADEGDLKPAADEGDLKPAADEGDLRPAADEEWDLKEVFTANQIKRSDAPMCESDECDGKPNRKACSKWVSNRNEPWFTCLDCQER
jgi:hypothetical protein